jgi:alkyl hydroperoxide reductase subunit AhpF
MITLEIYISENCWSCEESVRIVEEVGPLFPEVDFSLRTLHTSEVPQEVFAVPTYVLEGKVVYLGNPTREQLVLKLQTTQKRVFAK